MRGKKELRINPKNQKKNSDTSIFVEDKSLKIVCGQLCFLMSCFFHQSGKMARGLFESWVVFIELGCENCHFLG